MVLINNSINDNKVFEFQITDWNSYHETDSEDEKKYVIQLFGRTEDDKDVCIKVTDFTPYFYVQVPTNWKKKHVDKFVYYLKRKVSWATNNNPNYAYDLSNSLVNYKMVEKHNFYNFTKKKYFNFVMLVFKSQIAMREFSNVLARPLKTEGLTKEPMLYQRFESNIEPHIRCMHINNLSSCGWVTIDNKNIKNNSEYSNCDYSYSVQWKHIKPSNNDDRMAPLKIMGYDIECVSCDHNFPQAERETDKIIQIGITMYRYGSMECYEQHILTLKKCARIKGTNVECYKTEKGLIRGWAKKISEIRPDFKGGYNNFGFDDKYIFDRINRIDREEAARQGISVNELDNRFLDEILNIMGKVNNIHLIENEGVNKLTDDTNTRQHEGIRKSLTYFEIKNLSSSALGDNELKFFQVPGIISVDMMKVIQRDHRLIGYKLDNVSANFITQKALRCVETGKNNDDDDLDISIYTESTKALEKDSYIQIMVDDGYSSSPLCEGAKYKVIDIDGITETVYDENDKKNVTYSYQAIKTKISQKDTEQLREVLTNKLLRVYWTFAKDDMHHTLINKYFNEGDPKKIRQIAKYCIKDCKLVNLLLAKLEIIVNSVGMAKVCHVPLSYLFLRGQGVKIFSLVSKKCREKNFLIPVLRRNKKDNDGDDDNTYEGATVITPKPNVYLSPIGVLDYSSLYPNSMRERNLSPECYINDNKYDNLPGYLYHDVTIILKDKKGKIIRNLDGSPKKEHHRFAQELISDKQINTEMKDVFDKINKTMNNNIETILQQTYFTIKNIEDKIKKEKLITDSRIEDISFNDVFSTNKKAKLIETEKIEMKNRLKIYLEIDEKIKEINLKKKLSIDNIDKSLNADEKSNEISRIEDTHNKNIKNVLEKYIISEKEREEMITMEREKAAKSMNDEKSKVYNIVDGKMVRYGILPEILTELLNKRKETNGRLAVEKDSFVKAILNALQLAFKVTANSLYGQTGAPTSPIFFIAIAASTTAIGRERLHYARKMVEDNFPGSEVIYGDTDSIFINFHIKDENGQERTDKEALIQTIAKCQRAAKLINQNVPKPQSIVYEKTFHPFILVAKKKYVGLLFETNPNKYFLKSMGIVLKRRDNAPIVKIVVGGIIDYILKNRDIDKAVEYTRNVLSKLMNGEYPIDKFIISKTLKSKYKKPSTIAHKVLADRMAIRDPGNKPQINDRIPFVYVVKDMGNKKKKDILQGDLIEHPDYVIQNNMKIDYLYYLEHQIIKPATQILELMIDSRSVNKLFDEYKITEENKRKGRRSILEFVPDSKKKNVIMNGSKTTKLVLKSQKNRKIEPKYQNLPYIGNTRKLECKNLGNWMYGDNAKQSSIDDGELDL
ncbi:B-family DNA polymerase [Megavirus baoshan]|uniref:DNA polymerase n=1 Tax=Megavirus baoshan TaxID=2496520 RepID=A0A3S8UX48_9VIRU|nr:B-family DNA polymerase [Megavirus baoshan]AZL89277.1 B-family DNA polymerase [Megavirus baoshan]